MSNEKCYVANKLIAETKTATPCSSVLLDINDHGEDFFDSEIMRKQLSEALFWELRFISR